MSSTQAPPANQQANIALLMRPEIEARVVASDLRNRLSSEHALQSIRPSELSETSKAQLADVEYIFTTWYSPRIDESILSAAPKLKGVLHCAGSVRPITSDAFWESGIPISSAYHANSVPVADFTYAQIILSLKGFWRNSRVYREERNIPLSRTEGPGTRNVAVGLIALGSIARLLIEKLRSLDIKILAYDPYVTPEKAAELGVELVSLEQVFEQSQVVSCHAPLNEHTHGLVNETHLTQMPPNGVFINTARGKLVDADGLIHALRQRPDLHALLDVTDPEPLPTDSPLFDLPNAIISPHIAGSVGYECYNLGDAMADELERHLSGQALQWQINRKMAEIMT